MLIEEIESFIDDEDFLNFENDLKTKRAVERNMEIIGEAMNRIIDKDASIQLSNSRKIVNTRNRIIHGYDTVSDSYLEHNNKSYSNSKAGSGKYYKFLIA